MSAEDQAARPVRYLASVCAGCRHTYNFHASAGNCILMTCNCGRFVDQDADDQADGPAEAERRSQHAWWAEAASLNAENEALRAENEQLRGHILDIDAHATPDGDIPDDPGYVGLYLVTAGALHRALGKVGHSSPSCTAEARVAAVRVLAEKRRQVVPGPNGDVTVGGLHVLEVFALLDGPAEAPANRDDRTQILADLAPILSDSLDDIRAAVGLPADTSEPWMVVDAVRRLVGLAEAPANDDDMFGTTCAECGEPITDERPSVGEAPDGSGPMHAGCGEPCVCGTAFTCLAHDHEDDEPVGPAEAAELATPSQLQVAASLGVAEAGAPEPGYPRIADAIDVACEAADIDLTVVHDGRVLDHGPGLRWLATVLDKAGLIDWTAFADVARPTPNSELDVVDAAARALQHRWAFYADRDDSMSLGDAHELVAVVRAALAGSATTREEEA